MASERNRLAQEKSPYLLQHAGNPVDWYPWGEEAFALAKTEDKPIFLSIGYSTCHWCHVMAHESFEDPAVAKLMNDNMVSIKVDREERPDIDMQYMKVCQMMTGSGGWPLTIVMTPDKLPFFAATYIPKETRFGRAGMMDLIPRLGELWRTRKAELLGSAQQMVAALQAAPAERGRKITKADLDACYEQLLRMNDEEWGGFGIAPKFPSPHSLVFLMRYWKRTGKLKAMAMAERTLQSLQQGGIQDHIGYGFHRYSTDRKWLVPHFEKMIYDQALLVSAFLEAYQATGKEEYALTARRTLEYVLRDMTSSLGGFYTAEDADSEGKEGKFYLWTPQEIRSVLGDHDSDMVIKAFYIVEGGNFADETTGEKTGESIPHLGRPLGDLALDLHVPVSELEGRLDAARQRLFAYRERRVRPLKDDKILTDWNGLMAAAFAQAGRVLRDGRYVEAARRAAEFVLGNLIDSRGRLLHAYRYGDARVPGAIDDYAFMVHSLLELYETTFESRYLKHALSLNRTMLEHFWDSTGGGLFFTPDDGEPLLARHKEAYDGAIPSGNSVAMLNLVRLSRITGDTGLEQRASRIGESFANEVGASPSGHTQLMVAVDFALGPSYEVVIAGNRDNTRNMLRALNSLYAPRKVVILVPDGEEAGEIHDLAPFTRDLVALNNKATAYVCVNQACHSPTTDEAVMLSSLGGVSGSGRQ